MKEESQTLEQVFEGTRRESRWRKLRERVESYADRIAPPVEAIFGGKMASRAPTTSTC